MVKNSASPKRPFFFFFCNILRGEVWIGLVLSCLRWKLSAGICTVFFYFFNFVNLFYAE